MELYLYLLLFLSLFFLIKILLSKKNKNLPPTPPSLPIIGHLHLFKKPLHRTLAKLSANYGPVLYLRFGSLSVVVVSSPSAIKECLTKKNDIIFADRPKLMMGEILGQNYTSLISAPYGAHWRNLRRISATEILSTNRIQMFSQVRLKELNTTIKRLAAVYGDEYRTVNMKSIFFELTLNIMMMMIAGKRYYGEGVDDSEETKDYQEMVSDTVSLSGASNIGDYLPGLRWLGVNGYEKTLRKLKVKRDACMKRLIEGRRKARSEGGEKSATLIDVLLSLQENEPEYYSDEMILGFIWVLFVAGTDTSSATLEWAMSLLLNNPEVLKKAQSEIDNKVEAGRLVTESDLNHLPYLHSIINETLRMYPAGPLVPRLSSDNTIVGGYNIPKDTMLLLNLWSVHNDPNLWDNPTIFLPERFAGIEGTREGFRWLPFGSGRRACPGEGLAGHVVGLTLAALIQCFDWQRVGNEMVDMSEVSGVTLPKALPLEAMCKPRSCMLNVIEQI